MLERAFAKVKSFLEGDFEHPNLTIYDLQALVGYNPKIHNQDPRPYRLPLDESLAEVLSITLYYYPTDAEITLIADIEEHSGKKHHRSFKWNGLSWAPAKSKRSDLTATQDLFPQLQSIEGDYFVGFAPEEAQQLSNALRLNDAIGAKYLHCLRDNTRTFYPINSAPPSVPCAKCGNTDLIPKTMTTPSPEDKIDILIREQRATRQSIEDLLMYLKRKLGS